MSTVQRQKQVRFNLTWRCGFLKYHREKKGIPAVKRQLEFCTAYFKSSNISPLLYQKPWTFSKLSLLSFFSYLTYFLVFSLYFWWFFRVSQDHPGGLFKINPEFESTHSLVNAQAPLIFFISVLPYPKQSLQQMQPVLSTQLHYSVCIPANSQLKRNNDFHLNLTSSEVSDVALTISFLYLVNSNLL